MPAAPSGAQLLQTSNTNGVQYARYSTSEQPAQVISYYSSAWQGQGYTMTNSGGGGGGWGNYGGADAGATGSKAGVYVDVQSGGHLASRLRGVYGCQRVRRRPVRQLVELRHELIAQTAAPIPSMPAADQPQFEVDAGATPLWVCADVTSPWAADPAAPAGADDRHALTRSGSPRRVPGVM